MYLTPTRHCHAGLSYHAPSGLAHYRAGVRKSWTGSRPRLTGFPRLPKEITSCWVSAAGTEYESPARQCRECMLEMMRVRFSGRHRERGKRLIAVCGAHVSSPARHVAPFFRVGPQRWGTLFHIYLFDAQSVSESPICPVLIVDCEREVCLRHSDPPKFNR